MPLTSTSKAGIASSSRYIEVYRGDVYISRHSEEFEAVESAVLDAEVNSESEVQYEFRYPNKMIVVQRSGYIPTDPPSVPSITIGAINGGAIPQSNQASVTIVGSGFGGTQGVVTYSGTSLIVLNWLGTTIEVAWPDVPFNSNYSSLDFNGETRSLEINNGISNNSVSVSTVPNISAAYGIITSIPFDSIFTDDSGIELGVDKSYIRVVSGAADTIDASTGIISGVQPGTVVEYTVYDVSALAWSVAATETYNTP